MAVEPRLSDGGIPRVSALVGLIKEALLTIAIAVGGVWALFRYDFIESNSAKVRYELELARSKAQVQLVTRIDERVAKIDNKFLIFGRFFLKNEGTRDTVVATAARDSPPLTIYRMDTRTTPPKPMKETLVSSEFYDESGDPLTDISIDAGRETSATFAVTVDKPGLYMLNLQVPVSSFDIGELEKARGEDWSWSEQKLLLLE